MEKYEKLGMSDALLMAGDHAATNDFLAQIKELHQQACIADVALQDIEIEDVYNIGCVDELIRLQRNAAALGTLLSMCSDAAEYIKSGIHAIFEARDAYDKEQARKRRAVVQREEEYKQKKKYNAKTREKQPVG